MQINLLKSIVASIAGSNAVGIVDLLYNKKNVNEFLIAKKLKLTINQTRNILYRLADEGLVSFIRKKDSKKGGWYTYFWTLNSGKSLTKFKETLIKNIGQMQQHIMQQRMGKFFFCKNCNLEFNEETALGNNYTCPECGSVLEVKDMSTEIAQQEKEVVKLQSLLQQVSEEVTVINQKEGKARVRKLRTEERKRSADRAAKKKAMLAARKKLMPAKKNQATKKTTKKPVRKSKKAKRRKK